MGWEGPELDEAGGLEKAFQSPNSPFPLDDAATVEVGRLAEAAGEEKSAKPPMRSELPPVAVL